MWYQKVLDVEPSPQNSTLPNATHNLIKTLINKAKYRVTNKFDLQSSRNSISTAINSLDFPIQRRRDNKFHKGGPAPRPFVISPEACKTCRNYRLIIGDCRCLIGISFRSGVGSVKSYKRAVERYFSTERYSQSYGVVRLRRFWDKCNFRG